jgi:hypothetical protein
MTHASIPCQRPDNQFLGATLYDFYHVHRGHTTPSLATISTGSKLAAHMRQIGELDWAADEIHWASQEPDPVEIPPCNIGELIKDRELFIRMGVCGKSSKQVETQEYSQSIEGSEGANQALIPAVFDQSNYPPPWPLVPFSMPTVNLEKRIPFHLLPHKLVVHDPWNLLHINSGETDSDETDSEEQDKDDMAWTSKDDVVRTYRLQLSEMGNETVEKEKKLRAELVAKCQDISQ